MDPIPENPESAAVNGKPAIQRPLIVPVFLPHAGCPHRCAFCNQKAITGTATPTSIPEPQEIEATVHRFLMHGRSNRTTVQLAYYGGNFLGLARNHIHSLLDVASALVDSGVIDGIRFSTRPDTIIPEALDRIAGYPIRVVELGVQSMDNRVLSMANRGHSAADTISAVSLLRNQKIDIGLQLMVGLPGEDGASSLSSGRKTADLCPDFVRIYPTVVLKGSRLAKWYREGTYQPLSLDAAVGRVAALYNLFRKEGISVIRMGLQSSAELEQEGSILAGPYHPSFGELVYAEGVYEAMVAQLQDTPPDTETIRVTVHPSRVSWAKGHNSNNVKRLKALYPLASIQVILDSSVSLDAVQVDALSGR